ncbi:translation initiation factor IF-1 [Limisphaera sp. VF-2]|uniref:translation initiation factor IF-1 n=1 Tax=Limisphaera sp. VF-2 TaxID=3400418 RepID=UPI0025640225|nr:translation initiation factor IF-1 [Limisphaera sp.]
MDAEVIACLAPGVYRARLANGHELVAFVRGRARMNAPAWQPGDHVQVVLSAYDLSSGQIVWNQESKAL